MTTAGHHKKQKGTASGSGGSSGSAGSGGISSAASDGLNDLPAEGPTASPPAPGALFDGTGDAAHTKPSAGEQNAVSGDQAEEEADAGPYTMRTHPIFSKWLLRDDKEQLRSELTEQHWNVALLEVPPDALVPEGIPATDGTKCEAWSVLKKFSRMVSVGLPRPVVDHSMLKESLNPALLDLSPGSVPLASVVSPPRKGGVARKKGPQCKK